MRDCKITVGKFKFEFSITAIVTAILKLASLLFHHTS
jgi:hypothetical protein